MRLLMVEIAAVQCGAKRDEFPAQRLEVLAGVYVETGDRIARCAGNLPVLLECLGPEGYRLVRGADRLAAAKLASRRAKWIEHVNAVVVDGWEVEHALAQLEAEAIGFETPTVPPLADGCAEEAEVRRLRAVMDAADRIDAIVEAIMGLDPTPRPIAWRIGMAEKLREAVEGALAQCDAKEAKR